MVSENIIIQSVNIQGMSQMKKYEIERMIEKREAHGTVLTGLVETHLKEDRYSWDEKWKIYEERRDQEDKKGGGLLLIHTDREYIKMEKIESKHRDMLAIRGTIRSRKIIVVLVYMATGNTQASRERNNKITESIREVLDNNKEEYGVILLGDLNGHLGHLGTQQENENGRRIKRIAGEHNLVIANLDDRCEGETTWSRGGMKSTIDYIMIDRKLMEIYQKMIIDEDQIQWELSDHNLIEAVFVISPTIKWRRDDKIDEVVYWRFDNENIQNYVNEFFTFLPKSY